jgi:hypothetical protein
LPSTTRRECTGPKLGAVNVRKTSGRSATVSGTPLQPRIPAATSWKASPRYVRAHDGQTASRRLPQHFSSVSSGSRSVEYTVRISPVVRSIASTCPRIRTGCRQ